MRYTHIWHWWSQALVFWSWSLSPGVLLTYIQISNTMVGKHATFDKISYHHSLGHLKNVVEITAHNEEEKLQQYS